MFGIITAIASTAMSSFAEGALLGASVYLASRGTTRKK